MATLQKFRLSCFSLILFFLIGACGGPGNVLHEKLKSYGYIAYKTPLQFAGTGTLVGGNANNLSLIAHPQTCFPTEMEGQATNLRKKDFTTFPTTKETIAFEGGQKARLFDVLDAGSPSISMGIEIKNVKTIELEFKGAHIEYLDAIKLTEFYQNNMSNLCKAYLNEVAFIIQAVRINQMRLNFYGEGHRIIKIGIDNIKGYVNLAPNVEWRIEQESSLVIDTPKYIGYQLGSLREAQNGFSIYRSSRTRWTKFVFEKIAIFDKYRQDNVINGQLENTADEFFRSLSEVRREVQPFIYL